MNKTETGQLPKTTDIAIIGGGMVGLSLAILLAQGDATLNILVLEAYPPPTQNQKSPLLQPSFDARATALSESTRRIFSDAGIWPELKDFFAVINRIHISDRGKPGATRLNASDYNYDGLGYVIENRPLGEKLYGHIAALENVTLLAPAQVEKLTPLADAMLVQVGKQQCRAKLAVVADGAGSSTLKGLGIHTEETDYGQSALIANVSLSQPHQGIAYERFTEQGPLALLPLMDAEGKHRAALVWTMAPDRAEVLSNVDEMMFLSELHQCFGYRAGHFSHCGARSHYPLSLTVTEEQVRRHLVVVGNAAHFLHPVAGQGFNLALRDVAKLAEIIGDGRQQNICPGDMALLQRYVDSQRGDQYKTIHFSDSLPRIFGSNDKLSIALRNAGLIAIDLMPGLRQEFAQFGTGLATRAVK